MRSIRAETQEAIADAIREKTGKSGALTTEQMADEIKSIQVGVAGGIVPENKEWRQTPDAVQAFLDEVNYDPADYSDSRVKDYAPSTVSPLNAYPVGVSVVTPAGTLVREGYEQSVNAGAVTLYNDTPKKYTVYSVRDGAVVKAAGTLHPTGTLRQIKCTSASNVRDLGGWACDGGTVKYGKLFRGGVLAETDREVLVNQLGVRVDLDLRGIEEAKGATTSPLGEDIIYTIVEGTTIVYNINAAGNAVWKTILRKIFDSAKSDTPVYFHCAAGRDRTGTVACIIEALLGVSQSDIDKDYELTCFALLVGTNADPVRTKMSWSGTGGLIPAINALSVGSTFRDKVINWVASLGFTEAEISDFRAAMIEGTPSAISYRVVKNPSENCAISGDDVALIGSTYTATVSVSDGYLLSSLTVTMGGNDVTKSAVSNNRISVVDVRGDIVITAVAAEDPAANVPDYTMLEYVYVEDEMTGEVDTGYTNTANTGISVTFKSLSSSQSMGANTAICGNNDYAIGATSDYRVYKGTNKSFKIGELSDFMDGWHTVSLNTSNDGKYAVDGAVKNDWNSGSATATNFNETIRIFSAGSHPVFKKKAYQKPIKEFVIYENGSVVNTLRGCRRNADGNIGFYCIEDETFHASTGAVKAGPDIAD